MNELANFILMKKLFFSLLLIGSSVVAQEKKDTTSLAYALNKGSKVDVNLRWYGMYTNNQAHLTDYYAVAFSGTMKYTTGSIKGFRFSIGGHFTSNVSSSDLSIPDIYTNANNRYEVALFDYENPANKKMMDRIEALSVQYDRKGFMATFGKQNIQTPLLHPQDGATRPTAVDGLIFEYKRSTKWSGIIGWIYGISPRGGLQWHTVGRSIGVYPSGTNTIGTKSNYTGNLPSSGLGMLGLKYTILPKWSVQFWDYYVSNIFQTAMLQSDWSWKIHGKLSGVGGLQWLRQNALQNGGNADLAKTYYDPSKKSGAISARLGLSTEKDKFYLNYTRITKEGRYLFPREWGRDPFYTFIKRERNEGSGDVNAYMVNHIHDWNKQLKTELGYGYYDMPDMKNVVLNKFGMPSYHQMIADVNYTFNGYLKNLAAELIYTYKLGAMGGLTEKQMINKVNMHHINFILNYRL